LIILKKNHKQLRYGLLEEWVLAPQKKKVLEQIGKIYDHIPQAEAIVIQDEFAYVVGHSDKGYSFNIVDISNPMHPVKVGALYQSNKYSYTDVAVVDNYAFVTGMHTGLMIIDISNPRSPQEVKNKDKNWSTNKIRISGKLAYVLGEGYLKTYDISKPMKPKDISYYSSPSGIIDFDVSGNYVYIADEKGLRIVNFTDPDEYVEVSYCETPRKNICLSVTGKYAWLGGETSRFLAVIDISDPEKPEITGFCETNTKAKKIISTQNKAFILEEDYQTQHSYSLRIIDLSDPGDPVTIGYINTPGSGETLARSGDYVFLPGRTDKDIFQVIDVSHPENPFLVGIENSPGTIKKMFIIGNNFHILTESSFRMIDISNLNELKELCTLVFAEKPKDMFVSDNFAFILNLNSLKVFNITDYSTPRKVATHETPLNNDAVFTISKKHAYVRNEESEENGLSIYDLSDIRNITEVGEYFIDEPEVKYHFTKIITSGDFLYIIAKAYKRGQQDGLLILNTYDPENPEEVAFIKSDNGLKQVKAFNDHIYVVETIKGSKEDVNYGRDCIRILDRSDLSEPSEVGRIILTQEIQDFSVIENYIFIAHKLGTVDDKNGISIIDIKDPEQPKKVSLIQTEMHDQIMFADGGHVYVGHYPSLGIYKFNEPEKEEAKDEVTEPEEEIRKVEKAEVPEEAEPEKERIVRRRLFEDENEPKIDNYPIAKLEINDEMVGNYPVISASGKYAYIAENIESKEDQDDIGGRGGLRVVNVENPKDPVVVGKCVLPYPVKYIQFGTKKPSSSRCTECGEKLQNDPTFCGSCGAKVNEDEPEDTEIEEEEISKYIYIAEDIDFTQEEETGKFIGGGIRIVDVTDPVYPKEIGYCDTYMWIEGFFVSGDFAYLIGSHIDKTTKEKLPDWNEGLRIVNISDPTKPVECGYYNTDSSPEDIFVLNKYAYLAIGDNGLHIIDISNPSEPEKIVNVSTPDRAKTVFVNENIAYVGGHKYVEINTAGLTEEEMNTVKDSKLYMAGGYNVGGLCLIDVSDPVNPSRIVCYDTKNTSYSKLFVTNKFAFISNLAGEIRTLDISDPQQIFDLGKINEFKDIYASEDYLYVMMPSNFGIVDLSGPKNPMVVGYCKDLGRAAKVHVTNNYAYVVSDFVPDPVEGYTETDETIHSKLNIIDISDPAQPNKISSFTSKGALVDVLASGYYVYLAEEPTEQVWVILNEADQKDYISEAKREISDISKELEGRWYIKFKRKTKIKPSEFGLKFTNKDNKPEDILGERSNRIMELLDLDSSYDKFYFLNFKELENKYPVDQNLGFQLIPKNDVKKFYYRRKSSKIENEMVEDLTKEFLGGIKPSHTYAIGGGLRILEMSDPENPTELVYIKTNGLIQNISRSNDHVVLISNNISRDELDPGDPRNSILYIIDVSDPANSYVAGRLYALQDYKKVVVAKNYAYIIADYYPWEESGTGYRRPEKPQSSGLHVIDISDPSNPKEILDAYIPMRTGMAKDLCIFQDNVYILEIPKEMDPDIKDKVHIINVSDPLNPVMIEPIEFAPFGHSDIKVSEDYFLITRKQKTDIFKKSDLVNLLYLDQDLEPLDTLKSKGTTPSLYLDENYIYLAEETRLSIYDYPTTEEGLEGEGEPSRKTVGQVALPKEISEILEDGAYLSNVLKRLKALKSELDAEDRPAPAEVTIESEKVDLDELEEFGKGEDIISMDELRGDVAEIKKDLEKSDESKDIFGKVLEKVGEGYDDIKKKLDAIQDFGLSKIEEEDFGEEYDLAKCGNCGELNPANANSCANCGVSFTGEYECPKCKAIIKVDATHCDNCGAVFDKAQDEEKKDDTD
jgi:hypothetical protein